MQLAKSLSVYVLPLRFSLFFFFFLYFSFLCVLAGLVIWFDFLFAIASPFCRVRVSFNSGSSPLLLVAFSSQCDRTIAFFPYTIAYLFCCCVVCTVAYSMVFVFFFLQLYVLDHGSSNDYTRRLCNMLKFQLFSVFLHFCFSCLFAIYLQPVVVFAILFVSLFSAFSAPI